MGIELDKTFQKLGFNKLHGINCVYYLSMQAINLVYVDDLPEIAKNQEFFKEIYNSLSRTYQLKNLEKIKKSLGIKLEETTNNGLKLHNSSYTSTK